MFQIKFEVDIKGLEKLIKDFPEASRKALVPKTSAEKSAYYYWDGPEFDALMKPKVQQISRIVEEALAVPRGWAKHKWIVAVAEKHEIAYQSLYRYIKRHREKGICGLVHTKKNKGQFKVWTPKALEHWIEIYLKREHRKIQKKALFDQFIIEADRRGWRIGSLASASQHYRDCKGICLLEVKLSVMSEVAGMPKQMVHRIATKAT